MQGKIHKKTGKIKKPPLKKGKKGENLSELKLTDYQKTKTTLQKKVKFEALSTAVLSFVFFLFFFFISGSLFFTFNGCHPVGGGGGSPGG